MFGVLGTKELLSEELQILTSCRAVKKLLHGERLAGVILETVMRAVWKGRDKVKAPYVTTSEVYGVTEAQLTTRASPKRAPLLGGNVASQGYDGPKLGRKGAV